jgi:mannose/cellobiose epimerase-like protein (N-acyl-D-glucosamine 2-epimerase family)
MKKVFAIFAISGVMFATSCGNKEVKEETVEVTETVETVEEEVIIEESTSDTTEVMIIEETVEEVK